MNATAAGPDGRPLTPDQLARWQRRTAPILGRWMRRVIDYLDALPDPPNNAALEPPCDHPQPCGDQE